MMSEGSTIVNLTQRAGGKDSKLVDLSDKVHQLPCAIKYNGHCSVSDFFKPRSTGIEVEGLKVEEAYFRGRKLQGTTIPLPKGYCGFSTNIHRINSLDLQRRLSQFVGPEHGFVLGKKNFVEKKASEMSEGNSNRWEVNAEFENVTYWNHDSLPSSDDALLRSFHWLTVAKALHKPVTAEDLVSASIALQKD